MATYTMALRNVLRRVTKRTQITPLPDRNAYRKAQIWVANARNVSGDLWVDFKPEKSWKITVGVGFVSGMLFSSYVALRGFKRMTSARSLSTNETSERFLSETDASYLKLTLYQYQVCPFCCKLRAFLNFYGIPYQIVEVDPIRRKELKFSEYRKVPILVQEGPANEKTQLNDSSVIISALTTYMSTKEKDFQRILSYFPKVESQDEKKKSVEFLNKYEIMTGEPGQTVNEREEKNWREWVDVVLVHYISPNIYRNPSESLQAFSYISNHGKYSAVQKFVIKYAGAAGMFFVAKKLKKKYDIPDDVRSALYKAINDWTKAVGRRRFMGGDKPNLADLAVFGVLSSIEGLDTFNDMLHHTNIGDWYHRTKQAVNNGDGAK